jgi:hypothetical protein
MSGERYRLTWASSFLFFFISFFFQSDICFRCRLDNPCRFPNFQLPTIGVTADFLQDLVCMCKGKSICSKNCVCVEQNLSCTSICDSQGNEECRNLLSHQCLTREESFDKANFTLSLFRSLWTDLAPPFGSYRSATNSLTASTHASTSELARFVKVWYFVVFCLRMVKRNSNGRIVIKSSDNDVLLLSLHFYSKITSIDELRFQTGSITSVKDGPTDAYPWQKLIWPMARWAKKDDVVSHPVREWATGKMFAISAPSELYRLCTGINCRPSFTDVMLPDLVNSFHIGCLILSFGWLVIVVSIRKIITKGFQMISYENELLVKCSPFQLQVSYIGYALV